MSCLARRVNIIRAVVSIPATVFAGGLRALGTARALAEAIEQIPGLIVRVTALVGVAEALAAQVGQVTALAGQVMGEVDRTRIAAAKVTDGAAAVEARIADLIASTEPLLGG